MPEGVRALGGGWLPGFLVALPGLIASGVAGAGAAQGEAQMNPGRWREAGHRALGRRSAGGGQAPGSRERGLPGPERGGLSFAPFLRKDTEAQGHEGAHLGGRAARGGVGT